VCLLFPEGRREGGSMTIRFIVTPAEEAARKERLRNSSRECSCGLLRLWGHACIRGHLRMGLEEFTQLLCRSIESRRSGQ
jgi:hypothetical protein